MKTCTHCKVSKDFSEFYKNRNRPDGYQYWCKPCLNAVVQKVGPDGLTASARWNKRNPHRTKSHWRKYTYGITSEQFNTMLAAQGDACAICRETGRKWCIDHDHVSGKVRGILCYCCNVALGVLKDSARIASLAVEYLTKHGNP